MNIFNKQKLIKFIEWAHLKIFGHKIGPEMKNFIVNLSWSFFGGILASIILLVASILAGRIMGPTSYGSYNLVVTLSQILLIAIFLGMDNASVRAVSASKTDTEKKKNISSFSVFIVFNTIFICVILLLFRKQLLSHYSIEPALFWLLLLYSTSFVSKTTFDICVKGMKLFKLQSIGRIVEAVSVALFFVIFFFVLNQQNYTYYIYSIAIGAGAVSIFYFFYLRRFLSSFDLQFLKKQLNYARLFLANTVLATGLGSLDKIIIAKYLNLYELGVYMAYYAASVSIISLMVKMFNNVLFPSVSSNPDKSFTIKLNKLIYLGFIPLVLLIMVITVIVLRLYGHAYGLKLIYVVGFSILGGTNAVSSIYNSIVVSLSVPAYKKYIFYNNLFNIINLIAYGTMIYFRIVLIELILISVIANNIFTIMLQKRLISISIREHKKGIGLKTTT